MKQKMLDKFGDIKDKISNVFTDEKLQQKMTSLQYTFSELNQDTSTIPSLYYDTTSQKITKKTNGVIFIALVSFHQKKGSIVEYTYPSKEAILSSQKDFFDSLKRIEGDKQIDVSNEEILNDIENQLSAFCLPDGIHVVNKDTEFFIIQNYNKVLYCTFSYRQIRTNDNNNIIDDFQENTRDCVQKSLCIISTVPLFMYYYEKINVAMDLFMNQKILNDKSAIDSLYKDIAEKKESISMKYFKFYNFFSYRKLIQFINDDLIVLLKYILLEKKIIVFSHNPQNSTLFILSLLSLLPSGLFFNFDPEQKEAKDISIFRKSQKQIGFPFMLFNNKNMLYPIFTLFDLDFITKLNLNGFLLGTSNALVIKTKEIKADCIINLDESKIYYEEDSVEEKAIKLTDKEKALLNLIKSTVEIKEKDNKRELKGDWLIYDNKSQNEKIINEISEIYTKIGYKVIKTNAKTGEGVTEICKCLENNVTAFSGNSGVGKSTLINNIFKDILTQEGEVSNKNKRGKNTTTAIKLYKIDDNSYIADTPGFSTFDIYEIPSEDLAHYFIDLAKYIKDCKFVGCTHIKEDECGIKNALENKKINSQRYETYCKLYTELKEKEQHKW